MHRHLRISPPVLRRRTGPIECSVFSPPPLMLPCDWHGESWCFVLTPIRTPTIWPTLPLPSSMWPSHGTPSVHPRAVLHMIEKSPGSPWSGQPPLTRLLLSSL